MVSRIADQKIDSTNITSDNIQAKCRWIFIVVKLWKNEIHDTVCKYHKYICLVINIILSYRIYFRYIVARQVLLDEIYWTLSEI